MYLLTFAISIWFLYESEKKKRNKYVKFVLVAIAIIVPSVLAGVRDYSIGSDVLLYGNAWFERATQYSSLTEYLSKANEYGIGLGYATINYLVSRVSTSPHVFYFVYELIQLFLVYKAVEPFKVDISIPYCFAIYYLCYYNLSFNLLRQMMAVVIVLFAFRFIVNKKIIKFCIAVMIATTFHSTAIVSIILYPINWMINTRLKTIFKGLILTACIVGVVFYQQMFNVMTSLNILSAERYGHYLTDSDIGGRFMRLAYWGIIVAFVVLCYRKIISYNSYSPTLIIYVFVSGLMTLLLFVGSSWIIRIAYYFDVYQVIMLPILAKQLNIRFGEIKKTPPYIVIMGIVMIYWLITYIIRNGGGTYPYIFMTN